MRIARIVLAIVSVLAGTVYAQESPSLLTEEALLRYAETSAPALQSLEAAATAAKVEHLRAKLGYQAQGQVTYQRSESDERPLTPFEPIFSPSESMAVGATKSFPVGVTAGAEVFGQQLSSDGGPFGGSIDSATRAGVRANLEIDLLKNLFGRLDKANLAAKAYAEERAQLRTELDRKNFMMELRKLYWQLAGIEKSLEISKQLKASANRQLQDSRRRAGSGAADAGDIARNRAQVQSRETSSLLFEYQRQQLVGQLKQLVPALKESEIKLAPVDLGKVVDQVLTCAAQISADPNIKPETSNILAIIDLLQKESSAESVQIDALDQWDLKLASTLQHSGVGNSVSSAQEEATSGDGGLGYSAGVTLTIPFGDEADLLKEQSKALLNQNYSSQIRSLELQVSETHRKILNSLLLLQKAASAQNQIVTDLEASLLASRRKYTQARISLYEFVLEQDGLFRSQLEEINTKLNVIYALYDYFKVFNNHPCELNKI